MSRRVKVEMHVVSHDFAAHDVVAGHSAMDFVNTVTAWDDPQPTDWIDGYPRLIEWAVRAAVVDVETADVLAARSVTESPEAARALARAKLLRQALHGIMTALIDDLPVPADMVGTVERIWKAALGRAILAAGDPGSGRLDLRHDVTSSGLDLITDRVAMSAMALLQTFPQGRARVCAGRHCGWLYIDTSKGGRRRWCDMATCGNAAKARRRNVRGS